MQFNALCNASVVPSPVLVSIITAAASRCAASYRLTISSQSGSVAATGGGVLGGGALALAAAQSKLAWCIRRRWALGSGILGTSCAASCPRPLGASAVEREQQQFGTNEPAWYIAQGVRWCVPDGADHMLQPSIVHRFAILRLLLQPFCFPSTINHHHEGAAGKSLLPIRPCEQARAQGTGACPPSLA